MSCAMLETLECRVRAPRPRTSMPIRGTRTAYTLGQCAAPFLVEGSFDAGSARQGGRGFLPTRGKAPGRHSATTERRLARRSARTPVDPFEERIVRGARGFGVLVVDEAHDHV